MTVLMIGDVVGEAGLRALETGLPRLIARHRANFVIVNGENAVEGYGLNGPALERIIAAGADIVTSGNHVWEKGEFWEILERHTAYGGQVMRGDVSPLAPARSPVERPEPQGASAPLILRPANYPAPAPGAGAALLEKNGKHLLVINLQGREYMTAIDCPFQMADTLIGANPGVPAVIDFHAESPAEKEALGLYLDGMASIVAGTHTHVQTADAKILPGGTAYITDLGMTGPTDGVIGMDAEICLARVKTQVLYRMRCADGPCAVQGIAVTFDINDTNGETNADSENRDGHPASSALSIETLWLDVDMNTIEENVHTNTHENRP
jgi:calcineurin-like phosphoesterase